MIFLQGEDSKLIVKIVGESCDSGLGSCHGGNAGDFTDRSQSTNFSFVFPGALSFGSVDHQYDFSFFDEINDVFSGLF